MSTYDEIAKFEESTPDPGPVMPEHGMVFKSPDESELVTFRVEGMLHVPAVGDEIALHWNHVVVTSVHHHYGRDDFTGRPTVFTSITVETPKRPSRP